MFAYKLISNRHIQNCVFLMAFETTEKKLRAIMCLFAMILIHHRPQFYLTLNFPSLLNHFLFTQTFSSIIIFFVCVSNYLAVIVHFNKISSKRKLFTEKHFFSHFPFIAGTAIVVAPVPQSIPTIPVKCATDFFFSLLFSNDQTLCFVSRHRWFFVSLKCTYKTKFINKKE